MPLIDKLQNLNTREIIAASYVGAATTVVSGCAFVALIKFRVIHKILPASLAAKLDETVETIAKKTEPQGMTRMSNMANKIAYLQSVYGQATIGFVLGGLGTYLFVKKPFIPILPAIIGTGMTFGALMLAPKKLLTSKQRQATFVACCFMGGVSLGPMNWIAQQTNSAIFAAAMSTTVAFTVTPMITRGWIANGLLNQALSSSLALLSVKFIALRTFPKLNGTFASPDVTLEDKFTEFITTPLEMDGILLSQAIGNAILVALHSYPVLSGKREMGEGLDTLDEISSQRDALMVVGSVSYATFKLFQYCCESIARTLKAAGQKDKKKAASELASAATAAGAAPLNINKSAESNMMIEQLSAGMSSIGFLFFYVKFVKALQRSEDPAHHFRILTKIFSMLTPVRMTSFSKN